MALPGEEKLLSRIDILLNCLDESPTRSRSDATLALAIAAEVGAGDYEWTRELFERVAQLPWRDWRTVVGAWHLADMAALGDERKRGIYDPVEYVEYWQRWRNWLLSNEAEYKALDESLGRDEEFTQLMMLMHGPIRSFAVHFYIEIANTYYVKGDRQNARAWLDRLSPVLAASAHREYYTQFVTSWFSDLK